MSDIDLQMSEEQIKKTKKMKFIKNTIQSKIKFCVKKYFIDMQWAKKLKR